MKAPMMPEFHHIEFSWRENGAMRAHCITCDEYVDSHPIVNEWITVRRAQQELRAILEERRCIPDRRGPIIIGGGGTANA
jgi:hypothetical protein